MRCKLRLPYPDLPRLSWELVIGKLGSGSWYVVEFWIFYKIGCYV